jgi:hypothetical protein
MSLPLAAIILLAQTPTEKLLLEKIAQLEARLAVLEARDASRTTTLPTPSPPPSPSQPPPVAPTPTVNLMLDSYYSFNTNRPSPPVNQLRAFDSVHNSFNLNQATLVVEQQTSLTSRRYAGGRVDFQFGQATDLLQGSASNEPRPALYRNLFQAYGSLLAPIGNGLTLDFGKFASSLGLETNYAKDQFNYSRSYFFNFLPFYHSGLRASYPIHSRFTATYWLVNGANQTEDFNAAKSQAAILSFQPLSQVSGNFNFFAGNENHSSFRVLNSYWTWTAHPRLTLATDLSHVRHRRGVVRGGALYARFLVSPRWSLAARSTLFNDSSGLFSGRAQNLRELTLTTTLQIANQFQWRWEYRRDQSNQPFFLRQSTSSSARNLDTFSLGLLFWWGPKQGAW